MRDKHQGLRRKSAGRRREQHTFFVIASEGTETEPAYFEMLKHYVQNNSYLGTSIKVEPLRRMTTASDPKDIIKMLDEFKKTFIWEDGDEFWLVLDADQLGTPSKIHKLVEIAQLCRQKSYEFCLSTPCFEWWLLLHFSDMTEFVAQELKDLFENKKVNANRSYLSKKLSDLLQEKGGFQKNTIKPTIFLPAIETAITNAKKYCPTDDAWKIDEFYTRVHWLISKILKIN
jgi:RloB-like protein